MAVTLSLSNANRYSLIQFRFWYNARGTPTRWTRLTPMANAMRRHTRALAAVAVLLAALLPIQVSADDAPAAMIVFDGSGSMWGRLDGDKKSAKFELAREALRSALTVVQPSTKAGLMSFGHRRSGDCNDIEVISPTADLTDPARLMTPLDKLNPRGKGPVAEALRQAAAALGKRTPASIILIHDNADNCRQDACDAATEIAAANPMLKINLVALGIDDDELSRMSCVAKTTGGQVFPARTASDVPAAVTGAVKIALLDPAATLAPPRASAVPPVAAPPPPSVPSLTVSARLAAGSQPLAVPVKWRIYKSGSDTPTAQAAAPVFSSELAPGSYTVEASVGFATVRKPVDVGTGPTRLDLPLDAAALRVNVKDLANGPASQSAVVTLMTEAAAAQRTIRPMWIGQPQDADFILPAGTYVLRINDGITSRTEQIALTAGSVLSKDIVMGTGRLDLTASAMPDGPPLDGVTFLIARDDPESPDGRREIARSAALSPSFTLPAGTYYVTARTGSAEIRQRVGIGAGDTVKRQISFGLANLIVTPTLQGARADASSPTKALMLTRILSLDGEPREVARSNAAIPEVSLAAGRYRLEVTVPTLNLKATQDIDLEAGSTRRVALRLDAANVTLKLSATSAPAADLTWELRDAQGKVMLRSVLPAPSVLLAPGRYTARLEIRDRRLERPIDIAADGQPRTVEFAVP